MNRLMDVFRGARRIEIILALAAIAILLLQWGGTLTGGGAQTELESRLCAILSQMEGVGEVHVMVAEDGEGGVEGVLVVADGADDIAVRLRIQYAVQTLLGAEASDIEVVRNARQGG